MVRRLTFPSMGWSDAPLLPAALAMVCGLLIEFGWRWRQDCWIAVLFALWLLALPLWRWRAVILVVLLGFVAAGGTLGSLQRAATAHDSLRALFECGEFEEEEPVELRGRVAVAPELAPDRIYLELELERAVSLQRHHRVSGRVRLVVPFSDPQSRVEYDALGIDYGSRVVIPAYLRISRRYRNPGAPPFDDILESQGIVTTGWVKSPLLIEVTGQGDRRRVLALLYGLRNRAIGTMLRHLRQPTSGLLMASLFGNQHFLSREAAESFRAGGTFHLLVISGTHVAMIAIVVLHVLAQVTPFRAGQYAGGLLLMWGYALMVGAQPSVTRSVVMLTLVLAGRFLFRQTGGANSLAGAALVLLAWQPRDLFNPGFQISFLTVAAMVMLTGPLMARLREIGRWRPTGRTPWPPRAPQVVVFVAELLFWDEWRFRQEMRRERIRYQLIKARPALWLSRWRLQSALAWITLTMLTTIGVQIVLLPMMISGFHRVSLLSPLINVVEAVLVALLMAAGSIYLLLLPLLGGWMSAMTTPIEWLGTLTVRLGVEMASWPGGGWRVPGHWQWVSGLSVVSTIAVIALALLLDRWNPLDGGGRHVNRPLAAAAMIIVATLLVVDWLLITSPFRHDYQPGHLRITFLDVGQGDAVFISFPHGKTMMVDAGGDQRFNRRSAVAPDEEPFIEDRIGIAEAATMPFLWRLGLQRLDYVVASHSDNDHAGGFEEILRDFEIGEFWQHDGLAGSFIDRAVAAHIPVRQVTVGDCIMIDGVIIEPLSPASRASNNNAHDNNGSLVLRIVYRGRAILLTGDVEREAEMAMLAGGAHLRADILKVAHHGSRTSSSPEFLERVGAAYAVISAGRSNSYGHPHPEVVERISAMGMMVVATAQGGAITFSIGEGGDLRVESELPLHLTQRKPE